MPGEHRSVSLAIAAKALGAEPKGSRRGPRTPNPRLRLTRLVTRRKREPCTRVEAAAAEPGWSSTSAEEGGLGGGASSAVAAPAASPSAASLPAAVKQEGGAPAGPESEEYMVDYWL